MSSPSFSKESGSSLHSPSLLNESEKDFLKSAVENRKRVQQLMSSPISESINNYLLPFLQNQSNDAMSWVGGSRSWDLLLRSFPGTIKLTDVETVAISPGNWDVFFVTKSNEVQRTLTSSLCQLAKTIRKTLTKQAPHLEFTLEGRGIVKGKNCVPEAQPTRGESLPGYGILIYAQSRKKHQTRGAKHKGTSEKPFPKTLLLYLEVFHFPNFDETAFSKAYLYQANGINFLNDRGVFLFHHMITIMRRDKGFNVDQHRRNVFWKIAEQMRWDRSSLYIESAQLYNKLWTKYGEPIYDKGLENQLYLNAIIEKAPQLNAMRNNFEAWMLETWRGSINACIVRLDSMLKKNYASSAFISLVGGDAMRRYGVNTETKDIDTKIFYDIPKSKVPKLLDDVVNVLSQFTCEAFLQKKRIFEAAGTGGSRFLYIQPSELPVGVSEMKIEFLAESRNQLQFRLRLIKSNPLLPVDLLSIDYRAYLRVRMTVESREQEFLINLDTPILDVVLQSNAKNLIAKKALKYFDMIPVASARFLLKDLNETYKNKELARMRLWGQKREKDKARYAFLRGVQFDKTKKKLPRPITGDSRLNQVDLALHDAMGTKTNYNTTYYEFFVASVKLGSHQIKHKLSFNMNHITNVMSTIAKQNVTFPWPKRQSISKALHLTNKKETKGKVNQISISPMDIDSPKLDNMSID